jgi:hypothetical protein
VPKPDLESLEKHTRASRTSVSVLSSTQGATFDTCASQLCHAICQMAWAKTGLKPSTAVQGAAPPAIHAGQQVPQSPWSDSGDVLAWLCMISRLMAERNGGISSLELHGAK